MSRRDQIRMTEDEVHAFLDEQRVINVATMGPKGRPHLAPLWYVPRKADDGSPLIETWTYGTSQKIANLRRLAEATVLIESGESYEQLRGASFETDVEIIDDFDRTLEIGTDLTRRYTLGGADAGPRELTDFLSRQAVKRVGLRFTPAKTVTWDHRKLGGAY